MDLFESEGKAILRQRGIDVPQGYVCLNSEQLIERLAQVKFPVMIKAQVLAGGRGKAGGIAMVHDPESGLREGKRILELKVNGKEVSSLLVDHVIQSVRELYLSYSYDPGTGMPLLVVGSHGGIEVEGTEADNFLAQSIEPSHGLAANQARDALKFLGLHGGVEDHNELLGLLWRTFWDLDLELLEINPLMLTASGDLVVADVKMRINDDSIYRHPELELDQDRERTRFEREARRLGLAGVELTGPVAVLANGAGLTMSVMDSLDEFGLRAGAFLDLSGTDDPARISEAVKLLLDRNLLPHVRGVLVCVFGGITRCDTVAKGVLMGLSEMPDAPVMVRLRGIMEAEGIDLLRNEGMAAGRDIDDACRSLAKRMAGP